MARLEQLLNPYGPCPAALDAASAPIDREGDVLAAALRSKLSEMHRVPAAAVYLLPSAELALRRVVEHLDGPLVGFPPSSTAIAMQSWWPHRETILVCRGVGRGRLFSEGDAADLPESGIAMVGSPSEPLGSLLAPIDAVRMARACHCLLVDERFAEYSGSSLLQLALEFDNIVVLRSFDSWAGLHDLPCAWALASPLAGRLAGLASVPVDAAALAAANATLDNIAAVEATVRLTLDERARLFRFLRRLSFLEPAPSWGPFISARVALVPRQRVLAELLARGVHVHAPGEPGLEQYIRFGIGSRAAMDRLRWALLDLAAGLLP